MRKTWGETIVELAKKDERIILLTPDVEQEVAEFKLRFPRRFFNLGLTEQATLAIAGGMASQGLRPVVYSITPFLLERGFEFIKLDIDFNNLPVMLVGYSDYPTHGSTHSCLDAEKMVSLFTNLVGYFPETNETVRQVMYYALASNQPSFIFLKKAK
jgi:transketolase